MSEQAVEQYVVEVPRGPGNLLFGVYFGLIAWLLGLWFVLALHLTYAKQFDMEFLIWGVAALAIVVGLHLLWLRHVKRGRAWAVILAFIFFAPLTFAGFVAVTFFLPFPLRLQLGETGFWGLAIGVAAAILLLLVVNIVEPGLRQWLRINGRCPSCQRWLFGRHRPGTAVRCAECSAVIEFRHRK